MVKTQAQRRNLMIIFMASMAGLFVALSIGIFVFDMWVAANWGTDVTISWITLDLSHKYPAIPFMVGAGFFGPIGFLCGHLFGSQLGDNDVVIYNPPPELKALDVIKPRTNEESTIDVPSV